MHARCCNWSQGGVNYVADNVLMLLGRAPWLQISVLRGPYDCGMAISAGTTDSA